MNHDNMSFYLLMTLLKWDSTSHILSIFTRSCQTLFTLGITSFTLENFENDIVFGKTNVFFMLKAALFVIVTNWKQYKCPSFVNE